MSPCRTLRTRCCSARSPCSAVALPRCASSSLNCTSPRSCARFCLPTRALLQALAPLCVGQTINFTRSSPSRTSCCHPCHGWSPLLLQEGARIQSVAQSATATRKKRPTSRLPVSVKRRCWNTLSCSRNMQPSFLQLCFMCTTAPPTPPFERSASRASLRSCTFTPSAVSPNCFVICPSPRLWHRSSPRKKYHLLCPPCTWLTSCSLSSLTSTRISFCAKVSSTQSMHFAELTLRLREGRAQRRRSD
mmetsp:Transcript_40434/g.100370  ORF Transcript_40434/g.100370 Transcript_40434/m.100370 type:complete len:247 (-) Transcript_40434:4194-4934(-)